MTKEEMKGGRESVTLYTWYGGGEGIKSSDGGRRHKPGITLKKETGFWWRLVCTNCRIMMSLSRHIPNSRSFYRIFRDPLIGRLAFHGRGREIQRVDKKAPSKSGSIRKCIRHTCCPFFLIFLVHNEKLFFLAEYNGHVEKVPTQVQHCHFLFISL